MELLIQSYLRNHKAAETPFEDYLLELQNSLGIYHNRHSIYPNLIQFGYNQIDSPKDDEMVKECRGIILDANDNWNVIAYPFKRFFNYGEGCAAQIDWSSARVQEKVDGSLIIMYFYDNKWHVATRGSANADGSVGDWKNPQTGNLWTFRELFWNVFDEDTHPSSNDVRYKWFNKNLTYCFELATNYNKVVCDYKKSKIVLIGIRNNKTLQEFYTHYNGSINIFKNVVKEFPLTSFEEVTKAAAILEPLNQEGFVVVDGNFNRVKIKSPRYVALHHLRDGFGTRRLIDLIKMGDEGEFLTYFKEFTEQFDYYKCRYENLSSRMQLEWNMVNKTVGPDCTQKEFALEAIKCSVPAYLFSKRKALPEAENSTKFLRNMQTDKLLELLDKL